MMATAKDLRNHTREILQATIRGETVVVTHRGKPAAKMIPFSDQKGASLFEPPPCKLFGIWRDRNDLLPAEYVRTLRKGRTF